MDDLEVKAPGLFPTPPVAASPQPQQQQQQQQQPPPQQPQQQLVGGGGVVVSTDEEEAHWKLTVRGKQEKKLTAFGHFRRVGTALLVVLC
jgi:hypothetical protein